MTLLWEAITGLLALIWHAHPLLIVPLALLVACPFFTAREPRRITHVAWRVERTPPVASDTVPQ